MERTTLSESVRGVEADIAAGRPEQALARAQELLAWYPRALAIQRVLGEIYLALRKPREALGALDRVLAGDPEDARACCARAIVHQMHGDTMAALAWYRRACDIRPEDEALRATYGELARSLGQPIYRPSRTGLARLYLRGDLYAHAIREWEMLIIEGGDRLEAQVGLAETLWRARQYDEAEACCHRVLANAPSCVKTLLIQAWIAAHGSRHDEAQPLMQRVRELDPDQRIAQVLFADELESGDVLVTTLIRTGLPGHTGPLGQSGLMSGLRPGVSRPLVNSRPGEVGGQHAGAPNGTVPLAGDGASGQFQRDFRETAFMIWGPEEETRERAAMSQQQPAQSQQRPSQGPVNGQVVPPALLHAGMSLDETEARQAINWVQWLKAQGALTQGDAQVPSRQVPPPQGAQGAPMPGNPMQGVSMPGMPPRPVTGPLSAPYPVPQQGPATLGGISGSISAADLGLGRVTGPLPPPTAEDLRSMFAQLEPQTGARPIVEADVVSADTAKDYAVPSTRSQPAIPSDRYGRSSTSGPAQGNGNGAFAEATGWPDEDYLGGNDESQPTAVQPAMPQDGTPPVVTLESLEQQFAASGFHSFEPRPGALAELAADHATPLPLSSSGTTPKPKVSAGPAPDDYPARLALARRHREAGKMDEAVLEYRAVLKNAADLFSDVLSDLRESVTQTPEHPEVHRLLGDAYIHQGDYLSALESYNRAIALSQAQE